MECSWGNWLSRFQIWWLVVAKLVFDEAFVQRKGDWLLYPVEHLEKWSRDCVDSFQGRFFTDPGDAGSRNGLVSRLKTDMCDPAGCIYELCFMLSVYMIARQLFSNWVELYYPKFKNWLRKYTYHLRIRAIASLDDEEDEEAENGNTDAKNRAKLKRWEADYQLERIDRLHLFDEYIEMGKWRKTLLQHIKQTWPQFATLWACMTWFLPLFQTEIWVSSEHRPSLLNVLTYTHTHTHTWLWAFLSRFDLISMQKV